MKIQQCQIGLVYSVTPDLLLEDSSKSVVSVRFLHCYSRHIRYRPESGRIHITARWWDSISPRKHIHQPGLAVVSSGKSSSLSKMCYPSSCREKTSLRNFSLPQHRDSPPPGNQRSTFSSG